MKDRLSAPWHTLSFERFLSERLPSLLAERLPLAAYSFQTEDACHCQVIVEISSDHHPVVVSYSGLPRPDEQGIFILEGQPYIVAPIVSHEELDQATVQCVGEQLRDYLAARMGQASAEMDWEEAVVRAFLPLDAWFIDFLRATAQRLDTTNWHSLHTHLRRILIPSRTRVVAPGQMGRVDPFETPEGSNIGKVFTIAMGAEIRDEKIVIIDNRPEAGLGHNAAQIPFLEHDDANRLLMGVNMMRQALVPPVPEPALVQTGNAPENAGADFWCGRNLLTAFIALGEGTTEDGLILSETCARRLNFPYPAEPGDKLANRHGIKGVVSQVLPDAQMPHLADGTPVEIVYSFAGLAVRMVVGLVREAIMGRIAHAEGQPAIIPPFQAPCAQEIRARLAASGLPESGMEHLRIGKDGPEMSQPSTVGWVYWYRLASLAREKMRAIGRTTFSGSPTASDSGAASEPDVAPHPVFPPWDNGQEMGELEINVLLRHGAIYNAREALTIRSLHAAAAEINQPLTGNTPYFQELACRLAAAGIVMTLENRQLAFRFNDPEDANTICLARQVPHPWERTIQVRRAGAPPKEAGLAAQRAYAVLLQANDRLERWLSTQAPNKLSEDSGMESHQLSYLSGLCDQLSARLNAYFEALLPSDALRIRERQTFSGQAVISPGIGLRLDQVGLPESIIRTLFSAGPGVETKDIAETITRSWVIIHRAPAVMPTSLLAFHPVPVPDPSIRLHPQACALLNADFDGDQVAVYLPFSEDAQREAGEKLSIAAHIARDPQLVAQLLPPHEGIWGLAHLSLDQNGREQIASILRVAPDRITAPLPQSEIVTMLAGILERDGAQSVLRTANALANLGYTRARATGASFSPFISSQIPLPVAPAGDAEEDWKDYMEACAEAILSGRDYANPNLGPQLLSAAIRTRSRRFLPFLVGPCGLTKDSAGQTTVIRQTIADGRTAQELYANMAGARRGLAKLAFDSEKILEESAHPGEATTVLARARRARRPGTIFARAAISGETDPLTDLESRLLVDVEPMTLTSS